MDNLISPIFDEANNGDLPLGELLYQPEFLREGTAVADYFDPPKIVIGTQTGMSSDALGELYRDWAAPTFVVGFREAEFI